MANAITAGMTLMVTEPVQFLGMGHGLSEHDLNDIRVRGEQGMGAQDYERLLMTLLKTAQGGRHVYQASNLDSLGGLSNAPVTKGAKKSMAVSISTDVDAMVLAVRSGNPACRNCGLFHPRELEGKPCSHLDRTKKKVLIQGLLRNRGVLHRGQDGAWIVQEWFTKKLKDFAFPAMGITTTEESVARSLGNCLHLPANLQPHKPANSDEGDSKKTERKDDRRADQSRRDLKNQNAKLKKALAVKRKPTATETKSKTVVAHSQVEEANEDDYDVDSSAWGDEEES